MRLLLDTNILLALAPGHSTTLPLRIADVVQSANNTCFASVASVWEVEIKCRVGKLAIASPIEFANFVEHAGMVLLPITRVHVLAELDGQPKTRDPFDRLLLAVCQTEGLRLITLDRALATHPLAWR